MTARHLHVAALALLTLTAACDAAKGKATAGQGRLAVSLVDAPVPEVSQVLVNVTRVTAHSETAGWVTLTPPGMSEATPLEIDLLTLQAPAAPLALGLADLPPGRVTQIRLQVTETGNAVVLAGGTARVPLVVPSGPKTGIKIHGPWQVVACTQTSIVLDFDAKKSIWFHPARQGSIWILRPVIHVRRATTEPVGCSTGCSDEDPCPAGQACRDDGTCSSEGPAPFHAPCTSGAQCLSGLCDETDHCAEGGAHAPCGAPDDCVSGGCDEGTCTVPPDAFPGGASCFVGPDCISNACVNGACALGGQGAACRVPGDCAAGFQCTSLTCDAP